VPTVRPATEEDVADVLDVHVASIRAFGPATYDDEQVDAWAHRPLGDVSFRESVRNETTDIVVAEHEGEVAGFGRVKVDDGTVTAVYVHPGHARTGVGSALLADLESRAAAAGQATLRLRASLNAVPFYERAGYERRQVQTHATTGGVELDVVEMEKDLSAEDAMTDAADGP